ncbi:2OG-Fe(II) oxygenase [Chitinimonas sp.]|uniref:2OG-Fe(II) oxygenase n=1 Tax=Chitinimonas sp. TaxID=1934313 RepID=UPI0035ADCF9D
MQITSLGAGVFTIPHFLSAHECAHYIQLGEQMGYELSEVNLLTGSQLRPDIRNNARVIFDDPTLAATLFERARALLPQQCSGWELAGLNERWRFYRYAPGEYFKWHKDGCFQRSEREESMLTLLIYLNHDFVGGETQFKWESVKPETGLALVFPHRMLHQGAEIQSGSKYVLRTDVMYRLADG